MRLKRGESAAKALQRILGDEARAAIKVAGNGSRRTEQVHEVRKHLKKMRTIVRLAREALGERSYDRASFFYRDLAHQLSDARDAQVLLDVCEKLEPRMGKHITESIKPALAEHCEVTNALVEAKQVLPRMKEELAKAPCLTRRLAGASGGWSSIRSGLRWIHRRGRRAFASAYRSPTPERFHEWRKRVKDLHYAARMIEPLWPQSIDMLAAETHQLSDLLGDDHDLTLLERFLRESASSHGGRRQLKSVFGQIANQRDELRARARTLGERIYDERSGAFVEHVEVLWHAWK
jgi:CHAD domain-containing protein